VSRETLVILNPASAAGSTGRRREKLVRQIESVLGPVRIEQTAGVGDAIRLARIACEQGVERLVVAGGDGTTGEVAGGVLHAEASRRPPIGLLPLGSGWDLARSLGLPRRLDEALRVIEVGVTRMIDAGRVEVHDEQGVLQQRFFVNEASAGLSGATVRIVGRLSKRIGPRLGFAAGAVAAILSHRPVSVALEIDGMRVFEGPVSLVVAGNGRYFGAGMKVAPGAELDDGLLEVVFVRGLSIPRLLVNLPSLFVGRHLAHPAVSRSAARELIVVPKDGASPIEVDGETAGRLPLRVEVIPAALQVFVPGRQKSPAPSVERGGA
jgi:YegS/Rv2252/BmrU family lipid kinase